MRFVIIIIVEVILVTDIIIVEVILVTDIIAIIMMAIGQVAQEDGAGVVLCVRARDRSGAAITGDSAIPAFTLAVQAVEQVIIMVDYHDYHDYYDCDDCDDCDDHNDLDCPVPRG